MNLNRPQSGSGFEQLWYEGATGKVNVNLAKGSAIGKGAAGDVVGNRENVAGDDELFGGPGDDTLQGGDGDDQLTGKDLIRIGPNMTAEAVFVALETIGGGHACLFIAGDRGLIIRNITAEELTVDDFIVAA